MKRLLATLVTAICTVGLLSIYLVPTAEAAPYTPHSGVIFNNPAKSRKKERAIVDQLNRAISATPRGETISIVMYLFNDNSTTSRLIAAHRRGVKVQVLIDDGANTKQVKKLRKYLGTSENLRRSFVTKCRRSCASNNPASTIHGKVYAFSKVGRARNVSIISSANPHGVNIYNSWNNQHTIANNAVMYNAMRRYFLDMIKDRTNLSYGNKKTVTAGGYQVRFYPQRPARIHYLDVLNTVSCRTAKNMGSKGRTVVRLGMWGFTNPRMDVARKLWSLHNAGCKVDVTLNRGRASRTIMRQLTKKSKRYGQMRVEDAWRDRNRNDYGELYIHHKALLINGRVGSRKVGLTRRNQRVVWTGSQNLTSSGSLYNDDMILRVVSSKHYFAYSKNFTYIQKHYAKRLRKTPPPIILKSKRDDGVRKLSPDAHTSQMAERETDG
jgi:phosphatidylserine/phosphatidylglycerophosphate/cardiolipin synthase-like enzyme